MGLDDFGPADEKLPMAMPTPVALIVVPTRELGVQVSLLAYRILGGGPTNPTLQPYSHPSRYSPGGRANMFSYQGPRKVKVAGVWDEQGLYAAVELDFLKGVHVVVGTPGRVAHLLDMYATNRARYEAALATGKGKGKHGHGR